MNNIRIISILAFVFLIIVSAMLWHFSRLQSNLIHSDAIRTAELYSVALTRFRALYTSEVVNKLSAHEIYASHDYSKRDKTIPLPATLTIKLGQQIGLDTSGATAHLNSPYPFPWREKENQIEFDSFNKDAWNFLIENPDKSFYRFEQQANKTVLRYASADIMKPQCINCHNTHADTPKSDWKAGDIRGVLSISLPLDDIIAATNTSLHSTFIIYALISFGVVFVIAMVIVKLTGQSQELREHVAQRTAQLEKEVCDKHKAMEDLTASEEQNRLLLNSAGEGIYGLDLDGKTTFVNPAACKMLGYEAEELLGQPMHALVHHSYADGSPYPREECPMYAAFKDGQVQRVDNEVLWRKDNTSFPIEYTSTPLEKNGLRVGAVVIFNDVSERKKIDKMKEEFISTVNHELRTPLTSIKGALGLINSGTLGEFPEKSRDMLNVAYENSERLALIINDLLDLSKLNSLEHTFSLETINIYDLIEETIESIRADADKYRINLSWKAFDDDDIYIEGDRHRLIQVLSNLISNAIKYSPEAADVVIASHHNSSDVCISIIDTGPGVPLAFQDRIFDKFTQADSSDTRRRGGTGLGLAIAKLIVEKHNGKIGFHSIPGQGATFYFSLPLFAVEYQHQQKTS